VPGKRTDDRTSADLEKENRRLRRAVEELSLLNDLAREIGASLDTEHVMSVIVHRSVDALGCEEAVVTLIDRKPEPEPHGHTLVRATAATSDHSAFHVKEALIGWMMVNGIPLAVNRPQEDKRLAHTAWDPRVRSILCVPLFVRGELIGVLAAYNSPTPGGFTDGDKRLLSIIASQSAQIVENARLHEEEKALELVRQELQLAHEIQAGLLPPPHPSVLGYDIAGVGIPARAVGGDYFDFIPACDDQVAICLGDVSGKGLPAALLMASLQATVRGQVLVDPRPGQCLERTNTLLSRSTPDHRFATCFYGLLDPKSHVLAYGSAGHERPILVTEQGEITRLETGGFVLSFQEGASFDEAKVALSERDVIVLYSDGITDAVNSVGDQFGEQRLVDFVRDHARDSAQRLIDDIVAAVRSHAGGKEQADDMTLVVIRRRPATAGRGEATDEDRGDGP